MGKFGDNQIYELLKALTRGQSADAEDITHDLTRQQCVVWNISDKEFLVRKSHLINEQILDIPWKTPGQFTHAPTLESILLLCYSVKSWLDINHHPDLLPHVAVIHCSNGKTRTGILMACLLKYSGSFLSSTAAFQFFCQAR